MDVILQELYSGFPDGVEMTRVIVRLVIAYGITLTVVGLVIGIAGSFALTGALRGMLFGTSATDPTVFAGVSVLLAAVSVLSCYGPARRAVRVEPIIALRHE